MICILLFYAYSTDKDCLYVAPKSKIKNRALSIDAKYRLKHHPAKFHYDRIQNEGDLDVFEQRRPQ